MFMKGLEIHSDCKFNLCTLALYNSLCNLAHGSRHSLWKGFSNGVEGEGWTESELVVVIKYYLEI